MSLKLSTGYGEVAERKHDAEYTALRARLQNGRLSLQQQSLILCGLGAIWRKAAFYGLAAECYEEAFERDSTNLAAKRMMVNCYNIKDLSGLPQKVQYRILDQQSVDLNFLAENLKKKVLSR
jgi:hypothetical protein